MTLNPRNGNRQAFDIFSVLICELLADCCLPKNTYLKFFSKNSSWSFPSPRAVKCLHDTAVFASWTEGHYGLQKKVFSGNIKGTIQEYSPVFTASTNIAACKHVCWNICQEQTWQDGGRKCTKSNQAYKNPTANEYLWKRSCGISSVMDAY